MKIYRMSVKYFRATSDTLLFGPNNCFRCIDVLKFLFSSYNERRLTFETFCLLDVKTLPKWKSRKETPQKLTQLSSRSHPRHLVGKRTAQKDITIDTTSDSQVNSNFPNRWSPASLTFNNYFYLFLYLYITWITTNNNAPHLKSPKNQSRRAPLGRPAIKITGGLQLVFVRPTLALSSA